MEHPASLSSPQPWRVAAIVAAALAALELFVLVIVGIAFFTKILSDEARQAATTGAGAVAVAGKTDASASAAPGAETKGQAAAAPPAPLLPRAETSVIVLNGNGLPGAAGTATDRVRRLQYLIAGTGNAPHANFRRSVVMFRSGREGEATRLAGDLKVKRVVPLDGMKPRDLQGAHLALILGG